MVFAEEGTVCFEPDPRGYGEIAPVAHSDPALRHAVEDLAADGRLQLRAKLPLLHNARLAAQHPLHVVRNAWGDAYAHHLCPSSPAALEYALALSADCARLPLRGLVLEAPNWLSYAHGHAREFAQAHGNLWLEALLSLCFCSHCRQRAGAANVDADALAARVRARVDASLAAPVDAAADQAAAWLLADLLEMPQLAAYPRLRHERVAEAVAAIRAPAARPRRLGDRDHPAAERERLARRQSARCAGARLRRRGSGSTMPTPRAWRRRLRRGPARRRSGAGARDPAPRPAGARRRRRARRGAGRAADGRHRRCRVLSLRPAAAAPVASRSAALRAGSAAPRIHRRASHERVAVRGDVRGARIGRVQARAQAHRPAAARRR
ncbi:hypothetical protein FE772_22515 [Lysobacter enzymogenes]|nr:hypothetical protein [Lysobacter enzymogenes]QCW28003.1 hypothetical protein FE772_22515 [Lysobacter enzymogenes]